MTKCVDETHSSKDFIWFLLMVEISIGMSKWLTFLTSKCPKIWFTASVVLDRNFFFKSFSMVHPTFGERKHTTFWFSRKLPTFKGDSKVSTYIVSILSYPHKNEGNYCSPILISSCYNKILIANVCSFIWFLFTLHHLFALWFMNEYWITKGVLFFVVVPQLRM